MKAVAQAIPVYVMSVFKILKGVCKDITNAIARFWWGDDENTNRMHWWAWWKLFFPKKEGGMGFRGLHSFNQAILAKQCWRLLDDTESLCPRILRAKYYPLGDLLSAGPKKVLPLHGRVSSHAFKHLNVAIYGGLEMVKR